MSKRLAIFLLLGFIFKNSFSQIRYWVELKDKDNSKYSVQKPQEFLSKRSLDRRTRQGISIHTTDLPVNPEYVQGLNNINGIKVLFVSKWLNGALVRIDSVNQVNKIIESINKLHFVAKTQSARKVKLSTDPVDVPINPTHTNVSLKSTSIEKSEYGLSWAQVNQLGVNCMHEQNIKGQGMLIAVMDVGFQGVNTGSVFENLRKRGGIIGTRDFVDGDEDVYSGGGHGTNVLSCIAGYKKGVMIGTAPEANFWLFRTEQGSSETISEEYHWVRAAEYADSVGCDILTTSLGYTTFDNGNDHKYDDLNGRTAPMSIAATMAARKGMFVLNSAGNEGGSTWKFIAVAGDADSICTVGAVDTSGTYAPFSSVGPTSDGRIKPDLVATGWNTIICNDEVCYPGSGTSFSAPLMAGLVACFWQYKPNFTNIEVLKVLKQSASQAKKPDNILGWGIPNLCNLLVQTVNYSISLSENAAGNTQLDFSYNQYTFAKFSITDLSGKTVLSGDLDYKRLSHKIYTNNLVQGIYLLKVETNFGIQVIKFVKH